MTTELWKAFSGLAELGYAVELLLAAITVVMGCIGVLLCLLGTNERLETAFIEREYTAPGDDQTFKIPSNPGGAVTVRIEPGYLRFFRKRLCVVTIRKGLDDACDIDREVWYAKEDG